MDAITQIVSPDIDRTEQENLRLRIDDLCATLSEYLPPEQVGIVREASYFAATAHAGQTRKSGEPYVFHPIAVAAILAEVRFDHETIVAAILHDVIEDTEFDKTQLSARFGEEVAELVDGVSKLTQIKFSSKREAQAENFRKMFLAMARDIRVIMIKLADRLHNMRTLGAMRHDKRRRIARETLDIYAPIANRLGMNHLRLELEELGFSHLYPTRYRILNEYFRKRSGPRKETINSLIDRITVRLREEGIQASVAGRSKHLWSIYRKMREKRLPFREVYDLYAVRIIVESVDVCYRVLGLVHGLYKPIMGRFKDYIAIPKANGYQSLHTVLFVAHETPVEVQIRTYPMHVTAEVGVAAHWRYKAPAGQSTSAHQRAREWLTRLLDMQRRAGNSVEFLESFKVDLFPDEIYVFTPRGEIIELPRGATVVDFAYAIHSDVGNTCIGARINQRLVPLRTPLVTGQTVEVLLAPTARPNPAWLNFVVTAKARASIRHYLKHLKREESILFGKRLLEKSLSGHVNRLDELDSQQIAALVAEFNVGGFDDILADLGLGKRLAPLIAKRLLPGVDSYDDGAPGYSDRPLLIKGTEGAVVNFGRCCHPLPGDAIMGYLSTGRGIVIHRDSCKHVADYKKNPDKWLEVDWARDTDAEFAADLRLDVVNRRGVLASVAAALTELDTNIENINTTERDGSTVSINLTLQVGGRGHLAQVMRHLRTLPDVVKIVRL